MKKTIKSVDYITKDYEGFRDLMVSKIPQYTPEWTDTSQDDMGIVLLELFAHGLDILSFYQDKAFTEGFLPTARNRGSIIKLCRTLGYELSPQIPAIHTITFTKSSEYVDDIILIPKGTKIGTDPNLGAQVIFETDSDLTIDAGNTTGTVTVTHGETINRDLLGVGVTTANKRYKLTNPDVLLDTLVITTQLRTNNSSSEVGVLVWDRVTDFLSSSPDSRHFLATTDEFNMTTIEFGNGLSGMLLPNNVNVVAQYRVGGGKIGNVGLRTINSFVDSEIAGIVSISNESQAIQLGVDVEDIEHARFSAPRVYRTFDRAITAQDFEDLVVTTDGVAKAKVEETFNVSGDINIYVAPIGYGALSQDLEDTLMAKLNTAKLVHDNPIIKEANYQNFDITINVVAYSNYLNSTVESNVESHLREVFGLDFMDFGEDVYVASIYREVLGIEGVRNLSIVAPANDITVADTYIPKLVNVTINVTGGVDA